MINFNQMFIEWLSKKLEHEPSNEELLWAASYIDACFNIEVNTTKDWAHMFLNGIPKMDLDSWLKEQEEAHEGDWDSFQETLDSYY
jgi:Ca2+-binding EF-hand superfamily protein